MFRQAGVCFRVGTCPSPAAAVGSDAFKGRSWRAFCNCTWRADELEAEAELCGHAAAGGEVL